MVAFPTRATLAGAASLVVAQAWAATPIFSGSYVTADAAAEMAAICPSGQGYPAQSGWAGPPAGAPQSATGGQPRIEQYRGGNLIATYSSFSDQPGCVLAGDGTDYLNPKAPAASGCGPFTRSHSYRLWAPGDVFYVYPAVYSGSYNQPWMGPEVDSFADYQAGITHTPDGVVIQGVVQNNTRPVILLNGSASDNTLGQAPVYFDQSTSMTWDSVDVVAGPSVSAGKAGLYQSGASNLTLSNMRISGFERAGVNGLFGAGQYSGTLTLNAVELDHNGGPDGPAHNAYIGASAIDANFTVVMTRSWSHDAYYGHLFKSRAQNGSYTANFFQGGLPQPGRTQAENYLLDIPNGGQVSLRNNIFVKNASGANANGLSVAFLLEGASDNRAQSIDAENNTFVTFAATYDGTHANYPFAFLYPSVVPGSTAWPAGIAARVIKNAYVGYCTAGSGDVANYRGDISVVESFAELTRLYGLTTKVVASDAVLATMYQNYVPETGTPFYPFLYGTEPLRVVDTLGARN